MAGKQAKIISEELLQEALDDVEHYTQYPLRNRVMLLLSHKAGLRAKEISALQWTMVTDGKGNILDALELPDSATKWNSERTIPLHRALHAALLLLNHSRCPNLEDPIIVSCRSGPRRHQAWSIGSGISIVGLDFIDAVAIQVAGHSLRTPHEKSQGPGAAYVMCNNWPDMPI